MCVTILLSVLASAQVYQGKPRFIRSAFDHNFPADPSFIKSLNQHSRRLDDDSCVPAKSNYVTYSVQKIKNTTFASEVVKTANMDPAYVDGMMAGIKKTATVVGAVGPMKIFAMEPGNADASVYRPVADAYCKWKGNDWDDCGKQYIQQAQDGGGQYFVDSAQACECGKRVTTGSGLWMMPGPNDTPQDGAARAVHEYMHVYQKTSEGLPAWLMEGGAVHMECLMDASLGLYSFYSSYQKCMKHGGGSSGIMKNTYLLFQQYPDLFATKAEDRHVYGNSLPTGNGFNTGRALYYDAGALAIAFAVNKSGKTSLDFVQQFYKNVIPAPGGFQTIADTVGWKKALLDFSGFGSMASFYADFKAFCLQAKDTNGSSDDFNHEYAQQNILESDSAILASFNKTYFALPPALPPANASDWPYKAKSPFNLGECAAGYTPPVDTSPGVYKEEAESDKSGAGVQGNVALAPSISLVTLLGSSLVALALASKQIVS